MFFHLLRSIDIPINDYSTHDVLAYICFINNQIIHQMKSKYLLMISFILFLGGSAMAQYNYKSAVGAKLGYGLVGSYKTFISDDAAIDLFGGIQWGQGLVLGAYYELHKPIESVENLAWYYGGGGSYTTWSFGAIDYSELGVSGVIGLDYGFEDIPLNLSIDYAPTFVVLRSEDIGSLSRFRGGYGALTARYILGRD